MSGADPGKVAERLGAAMSHAELVDEIVYQCQRRRLPYQVTPPKVIKCHHCGSNTTAEAKHNHAGWVDLVILGRGGSLFVEAKSGDGRRTRAQVQMEQDVTTAGLWYRCWRPADLASGLIERELDNIA